MRETIPVIMLSVFAGLFAGGYYLERAKADKHYSSYAECHGQLSFERGKQHEASLGTTQSEGKYRITTEAPQTWNALTPCGNDLVLCGEVKK